LAPTPDRLACARERPPASTALSCARSHTRPYSVRSRAASGFDRTLLRSLPHPTVQRALASGFRLRLHSLAPAPPPDRTACARERPPASTAPPCARSHFNGAYWIWPGGKLWSIASWCPVPVAERDFSCSD